jgi:hypothetical protein
VFEGALWLADLYGVEARRIGWQVEQFATSALDEFPHPRAFVSAEVVHHHYLPRSK